jgi:hypothetical protein
LSLEPGEELVDELDYDAAFANATGYALDAAAAGVSCGEDARD